MNAYWRLMRFDKPIGIYLLFWPVAWAMILTRPPLLTVAVFCIGVILMRAAGCVANDIADRNLDKWVKRTQDRPLTSGEIPVWHAVVLLVILLSLAASLLFFLNALCFKLAVLAFILTLLYPLCKRIVQAPQVFLGITFNLGVLMVFAQTQGTLTNQALTLYTAAALWTIAYDTLYAMADKQDDLKLGIKSTAVWFGDYDVEMTCVIYAGFFMNMIVVALTLSTPIWVGVLWLLPFLWVIYLLGLVWSNRENALKAFRMNHWIGLLIAGIFALSVLKIP